MLNLLKQDAQIGDVINLYLTSGDSVRGTILEIGENFLLVEVDGMNRRYFPQLIGGWDVVKDNLRLENPPKTNEQSTVEEQDNEDTNDDNYNDIIISLFDNIYEIERVNLSANIKTNAVVNKVSPTGVSVILDSGENVICHKGFMVGFSRANCTPGKRLFCGNANNSGSQKGICFISVIQMSFEEMRERFIQALFVKTAPRKPIINSIIAYFRKNNSGKNTKKIIADIRTKITMLGNTGKVGNTQLDKYISFKQYDKAFELIEHVISSSEDEKQKSALLLRRAQLYSSLKDHENAIAAYRELISFNETIKSPSKNLSHLYTELARLLFLTGDQEKSEEAKKIALMLNPQNSIAKKIGRSDDNKGIDEGKKTETIEVISKEDIHNFKIVTFINKSLVDDDIDRHTFIDSEIVSLNGEVTNDIANRLLDISSTSNDLMVHIEAAKALKNLPVGSYDIQDYEDLITNYSICKCQSLFSSYKKVIFESESISNISLEHLNRIKDCAIGYAIETIESIIEEDIETATNLFTDSLLLELSSLFIYKKNSKEIVLNILNFSLDDFVRFCLTSEKETIAKLLIIIVNYSIQCRNLWDYIILKSSHYNSLFNYVESNLSIKEEILNLTPPLKKRNANDCNFIEVLRNHEINRIKVSIQQLRKIANIDFDISSFNLLHKRITSLMIEKRLRFFNNTDRKSLEDINHLVSLLSLYQKKNKEERKNILSNALLEIDEAIKWNTGATSTKIGRFIIHPILVSWKNTLSNITTQDVYNDSCLLSLELDSPYYTINGENDRTFKVVLFNNNNLISEGYRLAIWIDEDKNKGFFKTDDKFILPNSNVPIEIPIPQEKWGNHNIYELNFAICSKYQGKWSTTEFSRATITSKRDVSFDKAHIDWHDSGNPPIEMFKGRDSIVNELKEQYCSYNRHYSYVLYGLSRTGKTSILCYLAKAIEGVEILGNNSKKIVLPLNIDLGAIYGVVHNSNQFWKSFLKTICDISKNFIAKYKPVTVIKKPNDFSQFILTLDTLHIHPLFMLDEFSYMQDIIDDGYINSAFLQYMRTISADKDLASFIFAGTYDIKSLIHNPQYNISGAFTYLREPDKPLFEISSDAAEELINMMQGKLDFSPAAIREIHQLTGDVPFWIQKLCLNCALFAVDNNKPDIGIQELKAVVCKMTGESNKTSYNMSSVLPMNEGTFSKTQVLDTDTEEMKIVLTSIAYLMKDPIMSDGVTFNHIKTLWADKNTDILNYNIMDAIDLLCERKTLAFEDIDNCRFYKFSIDLFRRWWLHTHFEFELQLSSFKKKSKK